MPTPTLPAPRPADVVVSGFTPEELDELRRGLVHRMSVAQSNVRYPRDVNDGPSIASWRKLYDTAWSAYVKVNNALKRRVEAPVINDEFHYLTSSKE